jgi:hypothetical protein
VIGTYIHCWIIQEAAGQSYLADMKGFCWTLSEDNAKRYFRPDSAADDSHILLQHGYEVVLKPVVKPEDYGYETKRDTFRGNNE